MIAQDPGVLDRGGQVLTAQVTLPPEYLADGPWGSRVQVIDYDTSTDKLYPALVYPRDRHGAIGDPFVETSPNELARDPQFHAQNVYAIVMRTLTRFEQALGRRVSWGFGGHQIKVVPHAFADANAFYSRNDEALLFGYFEAQDGATIYTCLSHDVIVHETTHALLDGMRPRFIDPSSPDQGAFHEGFADVVALLSVFSLPGVVEEILARKSSEKGASGNLIPVRDVEPQNLKMSALLGLAEQMGGELTAARGKALRNSVTLPVSRELIDKPEFQAPHRRGELLVAAVMNAFVRAWSDRMTDLREVSDGHLDLQRVAEEGRDAADYLLTMSIRALDYTPPVHLEFCDYLSASGSPSRTVRRSCWLRTRDRSQARSEVIARAGTWREGSGPWAETRELPLRRQGTRRVGTMPVASGVPVQAVEFVFRADDEWDNGGRAPLGYYEWIPHQRRVEVR